MNKNKIIFAILGIIVVVSLVVILRAITANKNQTPTQSKSGEFTLWTLDNQEKFQTYLQNFPQAFPEYKNTQIQVVGFENYGEYFLALVGAFLRGQAPDMFVLNNSDGKYFDAQLQPVDSSSINIDDFRKNYDIVFSQDLIESYNENGVTQEYLRGIPLGYQTLGMYYNFRELRGQELSTWANINDLIRQTAEAGGVLVGAGNGKTLQVGDILKQFLVQDGVNSFSGANTNAVGSALSRYQILGDPNLENKFDMLSVDTKQNNIDAFSHGDVQIVFGYQNLINQIDKAGYNKTFLRATTFPMYVAGSGSAIVDYNYFVVHSSTKNPGLANALLQFFASEEGQKKYLESFQEYLPSRLSLLQNRLEEPIHDGYSIKHKDFYNSNFEYTSFQTLHKEMYDSMIENIVGDFVNSAFLFENFRKRVLCISQKMITGENMSANCQQ